jgi:hypothetical protein
MKAVRWYNNLLEARPIVTKAWSAGIVFGLGDYLCQQMEVKFLNKGNNFDPYRMIKQASFGIVVAPYIHLQFCKIIPYLFPEHKKFALVKSVTYAVTISDGLFNFSFFAYMSMTAGKTLIETLKLEIPEKFIPVQLVNMQVWPFLTGFNMMVIPIHYRVLFDNFMCIFWNIYLSYVENNK